MKPAAASVAFAFIALAWGFAEAILFFLVADVVISLTAARHGLRAGLRAAVAAAGGAIWGGVIVYLWAAIDPGGVERVLDWVPAVSPGQIAAVKAQVAEGWAVAVFTGGFMGNPYKLYAAAAGEQGLPLYAFALASIAARLARFLLAAALGHAVALGLRRLGQPRAILPCWAGFWIVFYAGYFALTPW